METGVVWFRRDPRVHNNETLRSASTADQVVPVCVLRSAAAAIHGHGGPEGFRYHKTGPHRARVRQESVENLRSQFARPGE